MKTASFFTYTGPGRISIARFAPRGTPKGFRMLRDLAPGSWFNSVTPERYVDLFTTEVLGRLEPKRVWDQLHELAASAEPVMLCWEKPGDVVKDPATYCHRSLVARWLEDAMSVEVPELTFDGKEHPLLPGSMRKAHAVAPAAIGALFG